MADLITLVRNAMEDGTFGAITRNQAAQFGVPSRQYLGATLLPEMPKEKNMYREDGIRTGLSLPTTVRVTPRHRRRKVS